MACLQTSTWPPAMASLKPILQWVQQCLSSLEVDAKTIHQLTLVTEEVVVNSINYSNASSQSLIQLALGHNDRTISLEIADHGEPFNPLDEEDPDVTQTIAARQQGGLGIFFVKKIADRVEYRRTDDQNILTIWKHF